MTLRNSATSLMFAVLLCGSATLAGCSDPFQLNWTQQPDTVTLFSLARPELNLESGFDLVRRRAVTIQQPGQTGNWDFVLDTQGGQLVMSPPRVFGIDSDAQIAVFAGQRFDQIFEAPEDTASYVGDVPVPLELGTTYVFQTHVGQDSFGQSCHFFSKLEPLEINVTLGTLRFVYDTNPLCEDLELIPPEN